ncbi:MAG: heavy metal-binding domain-containing protein [Alphaproteobacteria bacterium]|nr:heavy metal-binding domain-containing protein [Alphaproteobacteria bacterium]
MLVTTEQNLGAVSITKRLGVIYGLSPDFTDFNQYYTAYQQAMTGLANWAQQLGATAVIGVRPEHVLVGMGLNNKVNIQKIVLYGTAVKTATAVA